MDGWTILLAVIAGVALVLTVFGAFWDRRKHRRRQRAISEPPDRPIPNFRPEAVVPAYLSELQAREPVGDVGDYALDRERRTMLEQRLDSSPSVPVGWVSEVFVTDTDRSWAVAPRPAVLICAEPVLALRELYAVLEFVAPRGRPLVVAAPAIDAEVLGTLEVNHLQRHLRVIGLVATSVQLAQLAEFAGATMVPRQDLASGYLPEEALGECAWWISGRDRTWVVAEDSQS